MEQADIAKWQEKLQENLDRLRADIADTATACGADPSSITLVVVTKTRPAKAVAALARLGQGHFGENRVDEFLGKKRAVAGLLAGDRGVLDGLEWHFMGLFTPRQYEDMAGQVSLVHSVDRKKHLRRIDRAAAGQGFVQPVLLEVNTSGEDAKHGFGPAECLELLEGYAAARGEGRYGNLDVQGLMTMAPFTDDEAVIRRCFSGLRELRDEINRRFGLGLRHLSMGMTNDYRVAIQEGATILRVGSAVFAGVEF